MDIDTGGLRRMQSESGHGSVTQQQRQPTESGTCVLLN